MHLLVLTDFSPAADHALAYADSLAAYLGAGLVLLHVQRTSPLDPEALTGALSPLSEGEIAAVLAQRSAGLSVPVLTEATPARVPEAAQAAVRRHTPMLVVLGRPTSAVASPEVVAHTTTLELLGRIGCPLLLVPEQAPLVVPPRQLAIAADNKPFFFSAATTNAVRWLGALPADITILHVAEPEDNDSTAAAYEHVLASGLLPATREVHQHGVRHLSVADGVVQGAQEINAGLLVVQVRHHSWLGKLFHRSVTMRLTQRTHLPILLLPVEG